MAGLAGWRGHTDRYIRGVFVIPPKARAKHLRHLTASAARSAAQAYALSRAMSNDAPALPAVVVPPVPAKTFLNNTTINPRPKLVLVGDSITELGSHSNGWSVARPRRWDTTGGVCCNRKKLTPSLFSLSSSTLSCFCSRRVAALAIRYTRRMDVINRGANGYTSKWGRLALPLILEEILGPKDYSLACNSDVSHPNTLHLGNESCSQEKSTAVSSDDYADFNFVIGYGANDSCIANGTRSKYHVSLEDYALNYKHMIEMITNWNEKSVAVALMTPPPCDTEVLIESRNNEVTKLYAETCMNLAREANVPVVNLWSGLQHPSAANRAEASSLRWRSDHLSDGLHLTPMGNYRVFELVVEMLERPRGESGLGLSVMELPRSLPDHSKIDPDHPHISFSDP